MGIESDYIIIGLVAICLILFILFIIIIVGQSKLKKRYNHFMTGANGKSLEKTLIYRLDQIDELIEANNHNERNIEAIYEKMKRSMNKCGIKKYDAFEEAGGKLSYALALLDEENNGFIINNVHSREGCYNYIKEIIGGNALSNLSSEEAEALNQALNERDN